jgi:hypothetical protein
MQDSERGGPLAAAVVIGGVLLLGMAVVAGYAARVLPAGARVPLNPGVPEYSLWLPKPAGLAAWFAVGAVTFAAFATVTLNSLSADWATSLRVVLLPGVMLVVLAAEAGAVILARRQCAEGQTQATEPDAAQETASGAVPESQ